MSQPRSPQVELLAVQLRRAGNRLTTRLHGITDAEYLWEPVAGCWTVRRRPDSASPRPMGGGEWVFDFSDEDLVPPPVTTIGWRLMHLVDLLGCYHAQLRGAGDPGDGWLEVAAAAAAGLGLWQTHLERFAAAVEADDDQRLAEQVRVPWWPIATPRWHVPALVVTEVTHHGAEIGLLRDLYRDRATLRG